MDTNQKIKVTNQILLAQEPKQALSKIARLNVEMKTAIKIVQIIKEIDEESKKAIDVRQVIVDKFCDKADDGVFKPKAGLEKELDKVWLEFQNTTVQLKSKKLNIAELEQTKLAAVDLLNIDPFIEAY